MARWPGQLGNDLEESPSRPNSPDRFDKELLGTAASPSPLFWPTRSPLLLPSNKFTGPALQSSQLPLGTTPSRTLSRTPSPTPLPPPPSTIAAAHAAILDIARPPASRHPFSQPPSKPADPLAIHTRAAVPAFNSSGPSTFSSSLSKTSTSILSSLSSAASGSRPFPTSSSSTSTSSTAASSKSLPSPLPILSMPASTATAPATTAFHKSNTIAPSSNGNNLPSTAVILTSTSNSTIAGSDEIPWGVKEVEEAVFPPEEDVHTSTRPTTRARAAQTSPPTIRSTAPAFNLSSAASATIRDALKDEKETHRAASSLSSLAASLSPPLSPSMIFHQKAQQVWTCDCGHTYPVDSRCPRCPSVKQEAIKRPRTSAMLPTALPSDLPKCHHCKSDPCPCDDSSSSSSAATSSSPRTTRLSTNGISSTDGIRSYKSFGTEAPVELTRKRSKPEKMAGTPTCKIASRIYALQILFKGALPAHAPDFISDDIWTSLKHDEKHHKLVNITGMSTDEPHHFITISMPEMYDIFIHARVNYGPALGGHTPSHKTRFRWWSDCALPNLFPIKNHFRNSTVPLVERSISLPQVMLLHPYFVKLYAEDRPKLCQEISLFFDEWLKCYMDPEDHAALNHEGFGRTRKKPKDNPNSHNAFEITTQKTLEAWDAIINSEKKSRR